jgi:hypothetical protein
VINRYIGLVLERQQARNKKEDRVRGSFRHGDGTSEILSAEILNARGEPVTSISSGEPITIRVRSRFHAATRDPMVGILLRTRIGMDVYGTNTRIEQMPLGELQAGDELEVDFQTGLLAHPATIHPDRRDPGRRWFQSRLAGRHDRLRRGGHARSGRCGKFEGQSGMARLTIKVHPRAKRLRAGRTTGRRLEASLAAPPVDGKANDECVRFLAELAGCRVRACAS